MVQNYREKQIDGTSYTRSFRSIVENPRGDTPHITFLEQEIISFQGQEIVSASGQLTEYYNAETEIPLEHPETGESLGTATHGQLYLILYSLYLQAARRRDATLQAPGE